MAEDIAALAAIIATRDEKAISAAYNDLIKAAGHDAAEEIYEAALQLIDVAKLTHFVTELERNTLIGDPEHGGLLNMLRPTGEDGG